MAVAMIYPEPAALRRAQSSPLVSKELTFSDGYLSRARTVLKYLPAMAMIYPESQQGRRTDLTGKTSQEIGEVKVSEEYKRGGSDSSVSEELSGTRGRGNIDPAKDEGAASFRYVQMAAPS